MSIGVNEFPFAEPPPRKQTMEESYSDFVESMVEYCHCRYQDRPCDGVLAGGLCDNIQDEPDLFKDERSDPYDDTDEQ